MSGGRGSPAAWRARLGRGGAAVLGIVLLVAAAAKALDPRAFAEQVHLEGLDLWLPAALVAHVAIAIEAGLGAALVLGWRERRLLVPVALLVALFLFLTGRAYWHELRGLPPAAGGCGCFGNLVDRTPAEAFWQDLALLALPLAAAWAGRHRLGAAARRWRLAAAAAAGLAALAFALAAPQLPLDDLATRLRPGTKLAELCAGDEGERVCVEDLVPELGRERHLVVIERLPSAALEASLADLNAAVERGESVWLLTDAGAGEQRDFFWQHGPRFEMREVPAGLLRPLYRSLPRSFAVAEGEVTETWSGLPAPGGAERKGR